MKKKFLELPIHHKIFFLTVALAVFSAGTFAGIFYAKKAFTSPAPSAHADFRMPFDSFRMKGETSGVDTHFSITNSEYLNITLDSTETVDLRLTSMPKVITMMFNPATTTPSASGGQATTQITISGLTRNTTYYKYEDDYHHLAQFTSDGNGTYSYAQDISIQHFVFIQTRKSTKFIADNETGGDCATIGNWNAETKTCTLTQDLAETVQIDSDGITLDGNGHAMLNIPEQSSYAGVYIRGAYQLEKTGVTVKNFNINGFVRGVDFRFVNNSIITNNTITGGSGIAFSNGSNNVIEYNTVTSGGGQGTGILLDTISNSRINDNIVNGSEYGISAYFFTSSVGNSILDNTLEENLTKDLSIGVRGASECHNNTIRGNIGSGGRPIGFFSTSTILTGGVFSELIFCDADNSDIRNVTIEGSNDKNNNGFFVLNTDNSNFTDIASDNNAFGIYLSKSNSNVLKNITAKGASLYGVYLLASKLNVFRNFSTSGGTFSIILQEANNNEFDDIMLEKEQTTSYVLYMMLSNSNVIHNSTFFCELGCGLYGATNINNLIYNNNFIGGLWFEGTLGGSFNLPKPIGGNYWSGYHTPSQGCNDANIDGFCDEPLVISYWQGEVRDNLPWTTQDGWKGTTTPQTLTLATTTEDDFIQDEKGVADKTKFTFSVVYTDPSGAAESPQVRLYLDSKYGTSSLAITPDTSTTTPTELHDGDFANGELFSRTLAFPKGTYLYHYEANGGEQRYPLVSEFVFTTGYSNVAFIPGLEASQLFRPYGGDTQLLWLPGMSSHVKNLYLSSTTGGSLNRTVYVSGVLKTAYGVSIYQGFLDKMEEMKSSEDIERFETFPYDWRKFQTDAATQLVSTGPNGEFYSMIERVKEMADTSPTGKVTIITHSNGGLVAKELTDILKQQGKANDIEKIIMVAAPELGTPKAILEILHGAEPFVLGTPNKEVTRELAENMKSAYSLLPSREYFNRLGTPVRPLVEFSTTTSATLSFRNIYDNSISDYDTLRRFLRGENGLRSEPAPSVTNEPNVLKENFLTDAEELHARQDNWTPPIGVDVIEIIGWGLDTPHGVLYTKASKQKTVCNANLSVCTKIDVIDPQPLKTTIEGDGTVQYVSAEAMRGERYWVKMNEHNALWQFNINRDHKNILEIKSVQTLLSTLVKNQSTSTLPQYIIDTKPVESIADKRLRISAHSPVSLHLYDAFGNHTGITPNPDTSSDIEWYEEKIPNSYYWRIGEGQYTGVGAEAITTIVLKGKEVGTFTLEIQEVVGGENASTTIFQNIPTTASTTATVQAGGGATSILSVDFDGNGTIDAELPPNDGGAISDPLAYISLMKQTVISFSLQKQTEKQLLNDIEQIERTLERFIKFDDLTKKIFDKLSQKIRNEKLRDKWKEWRKKRLARRDKIEDKLLLNLIENTEKDVTRFMKQKKISIDQADILFTMLGELKSLIK
jgi:nitrous oxidase accessory protein NosD